MHDIRKTSAPYHAKIGPMQGGTPVYEVKDTGVIAATLAPGNPVILIDSERTYIADTGRIRGECAWLDFA